MNRQEFEKFVLEEAKKVLSEEKSTIIDRPKKSEAEGFVAPEQIQNLVSEMKKINKKIDLRNPFIDPDGTLLESVSPIKEEKKELTVESQSKRWERLYSYEIPNDEKR